ncbi:hypothetical protein A6R68_10980 [Neotoma lepida]|uniref:Claudin n=1 Tax=Neotoma lepida TaxID=56216 RepID=A0A1A6FXJ6_NEOLE|nr:hypothetical protein A6R68_10980 [Neotoma lepida]
MYKGLWIECITQTTGMMNRKTYDWVLALLAVLQASQTLMVVPLVLDFLAVFVTTMGMKCTNCGRDNKVKKARIAMAGDIVFIVASLAALVACPWIGHHIATDFYNSLMPMNIKYEFGPAIFIGWAGSALVLLGGACSLAPVLAVKAKLYTVHPAPALSRILPRDMCELGCSACGQVQSAARLLSDDFQRNIPWKTASGRHRAPETIRAQEKKGREREKKNIGRMVTRKLGRPTTRMAFFEGQNFYFVIPNFRFFSSGDKRTLPFPCSVRGRRPSPHLCLEYQCPAVDRGTRDLPRESSAASQLMCPLLLSGREGA